MKRILATLLGAAVTLAVSGAAQAATIPADEVLDAWYSHSNDTPAYAHSLTNFDSIRNNTRLGTTKSSTIDLTGSISATLTGSDARIVKGSQNSFGFNSTALPGDNTNYLAIDSGGSATFTLSQPAHYFGFEWGSVDSFNAVSFYDGSTLLGTITGLNLPSDGGNSGPIDAYYANFTSNLPITKIVMSSKGNAFEVDNISISSVPVPAALPLFGAAIAGLGAMGKRRRNKAAVAA